MNSYKDPRPGADLLMHLKASSDLAEKGFSQDVKLLHTESCIACNGTGSDTKNLKPCHYCNGRGQKSGNSCTSLSRQRGNSRECMS